MLRLLRTRYLLTFIAAAISCNADVVAFEDLPDAYFFSSGGQNIGTYYAGLDFEPNVTALSATRFGGYDSAAFPPHSGDVVIWDASDDMMTVSFATPQSDVGIWYTSLNPITLTAFDSNSLLLGLTLGSANSDGTTGTSGFLSLSVPGISSIAISSVAGQYVLDDLQFGGTTPLTTPEAGSSCLLAGCFLLCAIDYARRRRKRLYRKG